jgi:hypothetical protein
MAPRGRKREAKETERLLAKTYCHLLPLPEKPTKRKPRARADSDIVDTDSRVQTGPSFPTQTSCCSVLLTQPDEGDVDFANFQFMTDDHDDSAPEAVRLPTLQIPRRNKRNRHDKHDDDDDDSKDDSAEDDDDDDDDDDDTP